MIDLKQKIQEITDAPSDINEHIPTLVQYANECEHITEMGVRWVVSTWAFLAGNPKKLISYDILPPSNWGVNIEDVYEVAKDLNIEYKFELKNVLNITIEPTDLLFLDTFHVYKQVKEELRLHSQNVKKYIIFHDTTSFESSGEDGIAGNGIWRAINEFCLENLEDWKLEKRFTNNNGLTILKRINK